MLVFSERCVIRQHFVQVWHIIWGCCMAPAVIGRVINANVPFLTAGDGTFVCNADKIFIITRVICFHNQ